MVRHFAEAAEPSSATGPEPVPVDSAGVTPGAPIPLVGRLLAELGRSGVDYCHWKSNHGGLDRSAAGADDLDLLVGRGSIDRFAAILLDLGFKETRLEARWRLPGVVDYYGYDSLADTIVHVHAHYRLVMGDDFSKNYHIPIERAYLDSALDLGPFRVPEPAMEYVLFVIRMMLKHATWESIALGRGRLSPSEAKEADVLRRLSSPERVKEILVQVLPSLEPDLFDRCVKALQPGSSLWSRSSTGRLLLASLRACSRRPRWVEIPVKLWLMAATGLRSRVLRRRRKNRLLARGGILVAIVGGDGAGKTTVVEDLWRWFEPSISMERVHMGKPRRSLVTRLALAGAPLARLVVGRSSETGGDARPFPENHASQSLLMAVRQTLLARERHRAYLRARRAADRGALVIADRFPLPQSGLMDGMGAVAHAERSDRRLIRCLVRRQDYYYRRIMAPEIVVVLRVHPAVATVRKTDEPACSVWVRSAEMWEIDWSDTPYRVIDAGQPLEAVVREVKEVVWSNL